MANYYCAARTNGFAVKDLPRFREEANAIGIEFDVETAQDGRELVVMLGTEEYGFPSGEDADGNEIDLFKWLPTHLAPGEVAVVYESGHEKLRYLSGFATAVNAEGAIVQCSITDVLEKAVVILGARLDRLTDPTYSGANLVWPSLPPPLPVEALVQPHQVRDLVVEAQGEAAATMEVLYRIVPDVARRVQAQLTTMLDGLVRNAVTEVLAGAPQS